MYKVGTKVKINGRIGTIVYINRALKAYQIMFDEKYGEVISFREIDQKEKAAS